MELSSIKKPLNVGMVNAGLQVRRRARVFKESQDSEHVIIATAHLKTAKGLVLTIICEVIQVELEAGQVIHENAYLTSKN